VKSRSGVSVGELIIILALMMLLVALALLKLKTPSGSLAPGTGVLADMKKIDRAKDQYAADHQKKPGDPVTMKELVIGGYLRKPPMSLERGSRFVVGAVGTPVTIAAEETPHEHEHEAVE
jgi:hypothetical protein